MDGKTDAEKLEKLKAKYNQLKEANAVLKKGLLESKEDCNRLEQQLKEKETTVRQQLEEIDKLQFQNGRISKQIGTLTAQVEELTKQKQQSGWSMGLISGKQQQNEAISKAEDEIRVLRDELMMKIQENEELHMQLFENQRQNDEEAQRLRDQTASASRDMEKAVTDLEAEKGQRSQLQGELEQRTQKIKELSAESRKTNALVATLESNIEQERQEAKRCVREMQSELARWVPFDDGQHVPWKLCNFDTRHGKSTHFRRCEVHRLKEGVAEVCKQAANTLRAWAKAFGSTGEVESETVLQTRKKMSKLLGSLSTSLEEAFQNDIHTLIEPGQRSVEWERQFHQKARTFIKGHRKWIVYQSLLLLAESSRAPPGRPSQELTLAHDFVDSLWSLHRCVRALLVNLRLLTCRSALTTKSASSTHFSLSRAALRRVAELVVPQQVNN